MQAHLCSLLLCKGTDLDCSWDPWGPEEDTSSSQLKGVWATLSLLAPQSLFFICSYSVPQTDLSPSVSAKVPLSQLSFLLWPLTFLRLIQLLKKLQKSQWPSTRHGDQGCLSLRRLFHCMCIWKRSSRSNFHAQEVQESAAEWNPVSRLKARWCICRGWELVAVVGEGVRRKSRSPPQCRGPVNLVNEEWAPGQMTHPQSSINTGSTRPLLLVAKKSWINRVSRLDMKCRPNRTISSFH